MSEHKKNQGGTESRREWEEKQQVGKRTAKDVGGAGERMVRGFVGSVTGGDWGGQQQWNRKSLSLGRGSEGLSLLDCWAQEEILWETVHCEATEIVRGETGNFLEGREESLPLRQTQRLPW